MTIKSPWGGAPETDETQNLKDALFNLLQEHYPSPDARAKAIMETALSTTLADLLYYEDEQKQREAIAAVAMVLQSRWNQLKRTRTP